MGDLAQMSGTQASHLARSSAASVRECGSSGSCPTMLHPPWHGVACSCTPRDDGCQCRWRPSMQLERQPTASMLLSTSLPAPEYLTNGRSGNTVLVDLLPTSALQYQFACGVGGRSAYQRNHAAWTATNLGFKSGRCSLTSSWSHWLRLPMDGEGPERT